MKKSLYQRTVGIVPSSVKTLVWSLFYQAVVFTADAAIPQIATLDVDPRLIAVVGIILAGLSKAASKRTKK